MYDWKWHLGGGAHLVFHRFGRLLRCAYPLVVLRDLEDVVSRLDAVFGDVGDDLGEGGILVLERVGDRLAVDVHGLDERPSCCPLEGVQLRASDLQVLVGLTGAVDDVDLFLRTGDEDRVATVEDDLEQVVEVHLDRVLGRPAVGQEDLGA